MPAGTAPLWTRLGQAARALWLRLVAAGLVVVLHLNAQCSGLPEKAFKDSRVSLGELFQFVPRRNAMKASVMAPQLGEKGQMLLLNCFGFGYLGTATGCCRWTGSTRRGSRRTFSGRSGSSSDLIGD